ncbi:MAG: hypothetical protein ACN2B6_01925 [Rickettsiales bacterium]
MKTHKLISKHSVPAIALSASLLLAASPSFANNLSVSSAKSNHNQIAVRASNIANIVNTGLRRAAGPVVPGNQANPLAEINKPKQNVGARVTRAIPFPGNTPSGTGDSASNDLTETLQSGVQDSVGGGSGNPDNLFAGDIPTAGLSPEQLGALSPAAGGSLTAEDDRVACMNAYLQSPDAFESAELKQKCAGGVDGNQAI